MYFDFVYGILWTQEKKPTALANQRFALPCINRTEAVLVSSQFRKYVLGFFLTIEVHQSTIAVFFS